MGCVCCLGFGVLGLGVQDSGFRVWDSGFGILKFKVFRDLQRGDVGVYRDIYRPATGTPGM